ncbi:unnamed protein product [Parnassius apollo]|uniref:(apollo) hypothetical protein n=1 Tax=Parnassius apollo TaxID=110799 RepID=A0A8S3XFR3_PARAO|nr:unnamed protein product [Parnassius apollo]
MNSPPKDKLLALRPDTFETIRKLYNLHEPGRMKEAVKILDDWVKKQTHFRKKDFSKEYLETTIICCKGSLERSKMQLDKICTYRTLWPDYFGKFNVKEDVGNLYDIVIPVMLPKLTPDHYRVLLIKVYDHSLESLNMMYYYKHGVVVGDYLKLHDYPNGFLVIADLRELNIMEFVKKLNLIEIRQAMAIYMEGYGMRLKGIHILTASKFVDTLVSILKQVLSEKVSKRIVIHKSVESLYEVAPKEIFPIEYGGEERSINKIFETWLELLSSKEHLDYLEEINEAKTDEACRQVDKFNENYIGMPGTFRVINVD